MSGSRFAIYFVPDANTDLYRFGAGVIGYDCCRGADVPLAAGFGSSEADWWELTREPRKYGFHATLKAPFHLRQGINEQDLIDAFDRFAQDDRLVPAFTPELRLLSRFAAIVPSTRCQAIHDLADACVVAFESFRAPLSAEDHRRRLAADLNDAQIAGLDRWGYPYVFAEFRFHMTLTGPLPEDRRAGVLPQLKAAFAKAHGDQPIAVDRLALVHQKCAREPFHVLRHMRIGSGAGEAS